MPFSTLRAVRTPVSDRPNSTRVMATAGCIPTTTVSASSMRAIAAMVLSIRPIKESTISSPEISISTPRAGLDDVRGQLILQRQRQLVMHVHLDGDEQEFLHLQYRNAVHRRPSPSPELPAQPASRLPSFSGGSDRSSATPPPRRPPASPWWSHSLNPRLNAQWSAQSVAEYR